MKLKLITSAALIAVLSLCCACALGATANASIVAPETAKITAPFAGTLLPFDLVSGDAVTAGDTLFTLDTTPVYAALDGTVAAVFAAAGDDAAGVSAHYGALAVIEPEYPLYISADTDDAYDNDDNKYIHAGEMLYLKRNDEKGTGRVTSVDGKYYTVVPSYDVKEIDHTGAGDAFMAALSVEYLNTGDIKRACEFANAAAALTVSGEGAIPSLPTRADLAAFADRHGLPLRI